MMFWMSLLVFGVVIGVVSGLLGIGGGVLLIPGLVFLFGFSQAEAQGTSLAVLIPPIGIFAAMVYYQNGYVRLPVVGLIATGFVLGAYGGAKLVPLVSVTHIRFAFGLLLLYVGFLFVLNRSEGSQLAALPAGLATLVSAIVAWVLRRRAPAKKALPPPDSEHEYYI
jgi:uncharacterized membrane protein YfcA